MILLIIWLIFDKFSSLPSNIKLYKRDFSNFNQQVLLDDMQSVDWHVVFDSIENPSDLFKSFYIKLSSVIDVHILLKQLSRKEIRLKSKPWISKGLNKSIQIKNKLFKKYIKSKSIFLSC